MAGPQFSYTYNYYSGISILISEHLDKYNYVVSSIEYIVKWEVFI